MFYDDMAAPVRQKGRTWERRKRKCSRSEEGEGGQGGVKRIKVNHVRKV